MVSSRCGKKALIERWDPTVPANLDEAPFGYTDEGYKDFRGLPYIEYKKIYASGFSKLDLSYADFSGVTLKEWEYVDCRFARTDFTEIYEKHCSFYGCVFKNCKFKKAIVGVSTSRYEDCVFERCDLTQVQFQNAVYRRCTFLDNRFENSFMDATGFWDCRFVGVLDDLVFRGTYLDEDEDELYGRPVETGLHNVDFSNARLQAVDCRDGCALEGIVLPKDGSSFLVDVRSLRENLDELIADFPEYSKDLAQEIAPPSFEPKSQAITICSLYDFQDLARDEDTGRAIYEAIKARFGLSAI